MDVEHDLTLARRINLNRLMTFVTLASSGSFKAAAARCHISQSALSTQIRLLEASLGVTLFHRTTRSVTLTDEGRRLLVVARHVAHEVTVIASEFKDQTELKRGSATLATIPSINGCHIPAILRSMESDYPGVSIQFVVQDTSTAVGGMLRRGEADLGILNGETDLEDLSFKPIFQDRFLAAVPTSDARLARRRRISFRELKKFPFLLPPSGSAIHNAVRSAASRAGVDIQVRMEVVNAEIQISLIREGMGVGVLPKGVLPSLNLNGCTLIEMPEMPPRIVGLAASKRRTLSPAANALYDRITGVNVRPDRQR